MVDGKRPDQFAPTAAYTAATAVPWKQASVAASLGEVTEAPDPKAEIALGDAGRRYESRQLLGAGGMGEVRLCRDYAIGRDVAVKTLLVGDEHRQASQRRFLREVRIQGQLEHPSIVPVYDMGLRPDGQLFFTMRRVRGHTL